jgi:hypothetical protein
MTSTLHDPIRKSQPSIGHQKPIILTMGSWAEARWLSGLA